MSWLVGKCDSGPAEVILGVGKPGRVYSRVALRAALCSNPAAGDAGYSGGDVQCAVKPPQLRSHHFFLHCSSCRDVRCGFGALGGASTVDARSASLMYPLLLCPAAPLLSG